MKIGQRQFDVVTIGCLLTCIVAITVVGPTSSPPTNAVAMPTPRDAPAMSERAWQNLLAEVRQSARDHVNAAKAIFRRDCAEMEPPSGRHFRRRAVSEAGPDMGNETPCRSPVAVSTDLVRIDQILFAGRTLAVSGDILKLKRLLQ